MLRLSKKADGPARDAHSKPKRKRDNGGRTSPKGRFAPVDIEERAAVKGEIKQHRSCEYNHLPAKSGAVVALQRFFREHRDPGQDHENKTAEKETTKVTADGTG